MQIVPEPVRASELAMAGAAVQPARRSRGSGCRPEIARRLASSPGNLRSSRARPISTAIRRCSASVAGRFDDLAGRQQRRRIQREDADAVERHGAGRAHPRGGERDPVTPPGRDARARRVVLHLPADDPAMRPIVARHITQIPGVGSLTAGVDLDDMPGDNPEEIHTLMSVAMNAGDLDAFMALYEEEDDADRATGRPSRSAGATNPRRHRRRLRAVPGRRVPGGRQAPAGRPRAHPWPLAHRRHADDGGPVELTGAHARLAPPDRWALADRARRRDDAAMSPDDRVKRR